MTKGPETTRKALRPRTLLPHPPRARRSLNQSPRPAPPMPSPKISIELIDPIPCRLAKTSRPTASTKLAQSIHRQRYHPALVLRRVETAITHRRANAAGARPRWPASTKSPRSFTRFRTNACSRSA